MGLSGTTALYFFKNNMGNLTIASLVSLFTLTGYVFIFLMPIMTKKLGNRKTAMIAYAMTFGGHLAKLVMLHSIPWQMVCAMVSTVGVTFAVSVRDLILIDSMRYGELKTGVQGEGIYASVRGFAEKVGNGIAPCLVDVLLDIGRFDGTAAVQPQSAKNIIVIMFAVVPGIIGIIAFISASLCRIEEKLKPGKA